MAQINDLPFEILVQIFSKLAVEDLCNIEPVCKWARTAVVLTLRHHYYRATPFIFEQENQFNFAYVLSNSSAEEQSAIFWKKKLLVLQTTLLACSKCKQNFKAVMPDLKSKTTEKCSFHSGTPMVIKDASKYGHTTKYKWSCCGIIKHGVNNNIDIPDNVYADGCCIGSHGIESAAFAKELFTVSLKVKYHQQSKEAEVKTAAWESFTTGNISSAAEQRLAALQLSSEDADEEADEDDWSD